MFICFLPLFISIQLSEAYVKVLVHYTELYNINYAPILE